MLPLFKGIGANWGTKKLSGKSIDELSRLKSLNQGVTYPFAYKSSVGKQPFISFAHENKWKIQTTSNFISQVTKKVLYQEYLFKDK